MTNNDQDVLPGLADRHLYSISVDLPYEILSLIAEKCIEPYNICCDSDSDMELEQDPTNYPNPVRLALVSKAFSAGIKQGLHDKFKGEVFMVDVVTGRSLPIYMRKHNLDFLISRVTKIEVSGRIGDPFCGVNFNEYPNLTTIKVCIIGDTAHYATSSCFDQPKHSPGKALLAANRVRELLVKRGRDMLWMDKLAADLTVLVDYTRHWFYEHDREVVRAVFDISQEEPVVVTREHRYNGRQV